MKNLKEARKYCGFSQQQVALYVNISQQSYSDYENNKTFPDENTLIKIADYLNVSVDYLLGREDDLGNISISSAPAFELTENEKKLITNLRRLPTETQSYIFGLVANLAVSS